MRPPHTTATPAHDRRRDRLSRQFLHLVEEMLQDGDSYADLSVERLIRAAHISRSTFYVYFRDKSELLSAMGEHVTADLAEAGADWFRLPPAATKDDLRDSLRTLFDTY